MQHHVLAHWKDYARKGLESSYSFASSMRAASLQCFLRGESPLQAIDPWIHEKNRDCFLIQPALLELLGTAMLDPEGNVMFA